MTAILAAIALVLVVGMAVRLTVFSGNRIRRMRWRIKVWMRPGQGFASHAEVACRWSRLAGAACAKRSVARCRRAWRFRSTKARMCSGISICAPLSKLRAWVAITVWPSTTRTRSGSAKTVSVRRT